MKKFLISIDTEGDNLWAWREGMPISAENAKHLGRFQALCEKYGFKPTYLTNYEMATSKEFVDFASDALKRSACSVGMHLHAWNSPPEFKLDNPLDKPEAPYLIEYPTEVMEEKIDFLTKLLSDTFETPMKTHRAGRWAMDSRYFSLLEKYGYIADTSVTPLIDWSNNTGATVGSAGSDYSNAPSHPYRVAETKELLEIPVSVRRTHKAFLSSEKGAKGNLKALYSGLRGEAVWLRPNGRNLDKMLWLVNKIAKESDSEYIMFMLHSSEFMAGGSPTFKTEEDIERLYRHMDIVFKEASAHFEGKTIDEYAENLRRDNK